MRFSALVHYAMCGLFQKAVSSPDYTASNGRMINLGRREVSKQVSNGCKTATIDVICFLCISLCSSTVQLHDSLGSRRASACSEAGFSSQNGVHA
jgi:hypothetical protein